MTAARTYHRDDLRGDLLRAGRDHVLHSGHQSLSVRTLAQTIGVSPGAPYHHFKDRRALLLAVALFGFEELIASAEVAAGSTQGPANKILAISLSFVAFAADQSNMMTLMYESELTFPNTEPALVKFQHAGRAMLAGPLREAFPELDDTDFAIRLLALWSTIYGFVTLRNKALTTEFEPSGLSPTEVAERTLLIAVQAALARQ